MAKNLRKSEKEILEVIVYIEKASIDRKEKVPIRRYLDIKSEVDVRFHQLNEFLNLIFYLGKRLVNL